LQDNFFLEWRKSDRLLFLHPGGEFFQIELFGEIYDADYSTH